MKNYNSCYSKPDGNVKDSVDGKISCPYLDADGKEQAGLGEEGEGLVVSDILPVVSHRVVHGSIGDEEEHQGAVAAVEGTLEEGRLAEIQVELTGDVELRVLETPHVVNILSSRERQKE